MLVVIVGISLLNYIRTPHVVLQNHPIAVVSNRKYIRKYTSGSGGCGFSLCIRGFRVNDVSP
jgi:hypothetical protein